MLYLPRGRASAHGRRPRARVCVPRDGGVCARFLLGGAGEGFGRLGGLFDAAAEDVRLTRGGRLEGRVLQDPDLRVVFKDDAARTTRPRRSRTSIGPPGAPGRAPTRQLRAARMPSGGASKMPAERVSTKARLAIRRRAWCTIRAGSERRARQRAENSQVRAQGAEVQQARGRGFAPARGSVRRRRGL